MGEKWPGLLPILDRFLPVTMEFVDGRRELKSGNVLRGEVLMGCVVGGDGGEVWSPE